MNDRYILLLGLGDHWAISKQFLLPQGKPASISIELKKDAAIVESNGARVDELHLDRRFADAPGPVTVGSWIGGMDPFSGKIQFLQILDLDKRANRQQGSAKGTA